VSVPVIVLTNGRRDCITQTIPSISRHLSGTGDMVVVDDSGDANFRAWLADAFPDALVTAVASDPAGYWRAMRTVWDIARGSGADACWFHEDDFVLNEDVDLTDLSHVLGKQPHLTQLALLRQAWFTNEIVQGGLIEALEAQGQRFEEHTDGQDHWVEHRACFTGNPCLIPRRTFERDWPEGPWSESRFGAELFRDPHARGAYWGRRTDPPRVEHIGHQRVGHDY
jgi:predicted nuclease of predicted toxin-antitoxin system